MQAAYSFYNVSTATPWVDLMGDALVSTQTEQNKRMNERNKQTINAVKVFLYLSFSKVLAKRENFDVFNALDLMENR